MRIGYWTPDKYDGEFNEEAMQRLMECGEIVAEKARAKCPVGIVSRSPLLLWPGKHPRGVPRWMARDPGQLIRSIRVVRKKTKAGKGKPFKRSHNVRIYAGHYLAFYARFVEFGTSKTPKKSFLRPALYTSIPEMKSILGVR